LTCFYTTIKLADGSSKCENVFVARVSVGLAGRVTATTFIVLPEATNNTLLGIDFLQDAGIPMSEHKLPYVEPHVQHSRGRFHIPRLGNFQFLCNFSLYSSLITYASVMCLTIYKSIAAVLVLISVNLCCHVSK
jgi:hypothetical protein